MAEEDFDAIVVGAGPAGSACAYTLAKAGKNVLLLERGDSAGAKNVSGGRLYAYGLDLVDPELARRAPLQRRIVREQIMLLSGQSATTVDYAEYGKAADAPRSYSVIRATLDEWFAGEAEAQGATFAAGMRVDSLLEENGRIVGIKVGDDEMRAGMVVAADGVNSLIGQQAGLFPEVKAHAVGVGVKETIELPAAVINQRFGVKDGEGAARVAIGCTEGISGGGFLYTNQDSISLGIVFNPEQAAANGRQIQEIFQDFKLHPAIAGLIEGGTSVEYGAHLVPEIGLHGVPQRLSREGLLVAGDAAQFGINTGMIIRGMDLAMVSGLAAARAILAGGETGAAYQAQLEELSLLPNLRAYAEFHGIFGINRIFKEYPDLANQVLGFLFNVDGQVPPPMVKQMLAMVKSKVSFTQLAKDAWKGYRSV
jgi:electron transfer flavoprotein-quinone oxidoreductase